MLQIAKKILKKIEDAGYQAYIVGGFVRDYLLDLPTNDIDVGTNATPKELKEIFPDAIIPQDDYGSIVVMYKSIRFEITTFRRELAYKNNRKPVKIEYIDDLYQDLLRRDFTINTICMDQNEKIIDLLNGRRDLEKKMIRTVGNSKQKLEEDALRILRAVRFATTLGFSLSDEVKEAILLHKHLLHSLSYERKKEELDKIFTSSNAKDGISLLLSFGLDYELELPKLNEIRYTDSLIAIWAMLDVGDLYPFSNNEKDLMRDISLCYQGNNLDAYNLYSYGLYVNSVAGEMKGESVKAITEAYDRLSIHSRSDIVISGEDIMRVLHRGEGPYLAEIFNDLERKILYHHLKNEKEELLAYCVKNYSE